MATNRKTKTLDEYCASIERFEEWYKLQYDKQRMSRQTWANIDRQIVQDWVFELRETLSIASVKKHIAGLFQYAKFLQNEGIVKENFCVGIEIPKDKERHEREYMRVNEAKLLVDTIDNNYEQLMVALMFYGGYRIEEVTNILVENVDLENFTITALRKHGKWHTLKVLKEIREMLVERVEYCKQKGDKYLFQSPKGEYGITANALRNVFKKWRDLLEMNPEYSPHDLRRCAASLLHYEKGLPLLKVSKFMNHNSVTTTMRYLKISMDELNDELENL
jgi:site-specific recombinase XerD